MKTHQLIVTVSADDHMTGDQVLKALREGFIGSRCENGEWADEDRKIVQIMNFAGFTAEVTDNDCGMVEL